MLYIGMGITKLHNSRVGRVSSCINYYYYVVDSNPDCLEMLRITQSNNAPLNSNDRIYCVVQRCGFYMQQSVRSSGLGDSSLQQNLTFGFLPYFSSSPMMERICCGFTMFSASGLSSKTAARTWRIPMAHTFRHWISNAMAALERDKIETK